MQKTLYDNGFYNMVNVTATDSANEIVPYILKIISPKSVCDVGCGQGAWLEVFRRLGGIEDFIGFDGNYVNKESLLFEDKERFIPTNLEHLPLTYHRTFDLAISLEVAEHISKQNEVLFIESLTRLAPVVLFSAAIPYQKGKNHVNCNYPEHWRQIFASFGYVPIDCIRSQFWDNENVTWWYSQNSFLYIA
jgi:2-polyprenyl-3-methyl-5-hydroxy-6-metoxy-1,4-benzoquinol methylase